MPVQQPVRYTIRDTAPFRIAGIAKPPYSLINEGPTGATIWIADNPGMVAGMGTPLYPGTSLQWTQEGDFFAIADKGYNQSLIISDVNDWEPNPVALGTAVATQILASGVALVDIPVNVFTGDLNSTRSYTTGWLDVTKFQSLNVHIQNLALSSPAAPIESMLIEFSYDQSNISFVRTVETYDKYPSVGASWRATIPINGAFVRFTSYANNVYRLRLWGSNRPSNNIVQSMFDYNGNVISDFLYESYPSFTQGMGYQAYIGPWYGTIRVTVSFVTATAPNNNVPVQIRRRNPSNGAWDVAVRCVISNLQPYWGTSLYQIDQTFDGAGVVYRFDFTNNIPAVNLTNTYFRIVPVTGYGAVA